MLKIFAKYGTNQKAAMLVDPRAKIQPILKTLSTIYGGEWLMVDECMTSGEILIFEDDMKYLGFDPSKAINYRYSSAIKRFAIER